MNAGSPCAPAGIIPPSGFHQNNRRSLLASGFSLVELLVVMAILVLLTLLAARMFTGGSTTRAGTQLVYDHLSAARQHAISKGKMTAVVIRTARIGEVEDNSIYPWGRIGIFEIEEGYQWSRVSQWRNLPKRTFIDSTYNPANESWSRTPSSLGDAHADVEFFPDEQIRDGANALTPGTHYQAILFRADGGLQLDDNIALRIVRGSIDEAGNVLPDGGTDPVDWNKLIIQNVTGRVKEIRADEAGGGS